MKIFDELFDLLTESEKEYFFRFVKREGSGVGATTLKVAETLKEPLLKEGKKDFDRLIEDLNLHPDYLRNIRSDLTAEILQFILLNKFEEDSLWKNAFLVNWLSEREAPRAIFDIYLRRARNKLAKRKEALGTEDLKMAFELDLLDHRSFTGKQERRRRNPGEKGKLDTRLGTAIDSLDRYYLIKRAKLMIEWNAMDAIAGNALPDLQIPTSVHHELRIRLHTVSEELGSVLEGIERLLATDSGYDEIKTLLPDALISNEEMLHFCMLMQNYCSRKINSGQSMYLQEYLFWIDVRRKRGVFLVGGSLPYSDFKNYITCCLKLPAPATDRARIFYLEHSEKVLEDFREEGLAISDAWILYHEGDYELALERLENQTYTDPYMKLDRRSLEIKLLYRLDRIDELEKASHNAKHFLYRTEDLPKERAQTHRRKIMLVIRIYQTPHFEKEKLWRLRGQVLNEPQLSDRKWLLQLIDEKLGRGRK